MNPNVLSTYLLRTAIFMVMFAMGLGLTWRELTQLVIKPGNLLIGLLAQMLMLPVLAFFLVLFLPIDPAYKVGIVLLSICPGGSTSNLVNLWLGGNLALCVGLTSTNAFLTQFTIPIILQAALWIFMESTAQIEPNGVEMMMEIFLLTLLPVAIGIAAKPWLGSRGVSIQKGIKFVAPALMGLSILSLAALRQNSDGILSANVLIWLLPLMIGFNVLAILISFKLSQTLGVQARGAMTISVEVGLQNTALAILLAESHLGAQPAILAPAMVYAGSSFFITLALAWWLKRRTFPELA
ncbi:MAG: bile acid:sodium symporter family protein [Flavobacteriales bacterium]